MLRVNTEAPEITGVDQNDVPFHLSDRRGKWVVLYFYPKDETLGCVAEARTFRDDLPAFQELRAEVVGVSVQTQQSHCDFAEHHQLNFPLIADPGKEITKAYQALGFLGVARRVTYLIDPEGRIRDAYRSEAMPKSHVSRARAKLREFQAGDPGRNP